MAIKFALAQTCVGIDDRCAPTTDIVLQWFPCAPVVIDMGKHFGLALDVLVCGKPTSQSRTRLA